MSDACVVEVTEDRFDDEVLRQQGTVLVDFYTSYCPPCKQVAPTLEQLCSERHSDLKVLKMNAAENATTAGRHGVSAVPTFVLFHAGKKVGQLVGVRSKAQFEKWIASSVSGAA